MGVTAFQSEHVFASGNYAGDIKLHDLRMKDDHFQAFTGHNKEVCGLTWSSNGKTLASGSDDNTVKLWSASDPGAITSFSHKESAVKAMAWSPHQPEILATGGGRADPYIRFWDTNTH